MAHDYSKDHQPVGAFLSPSDLQPDQTGGGLTQDQLDQFERDGSLWGVPVLSTSQCDQLCEELEELFLPEHAGREYWYEYHTNEAQDPNAVLFHALGAWRLRAGFHDLLWHPRVTIPAMQLLGGPVRFWHDQLFCKPAHHGGVVAWHQDYSYWTRTHPMAHLTCWIALDDATPDNGCLHYVPGSHRWDLLPITGLAGDMEAIRGVLNDEQWERFRSPVPAVVRRGEASFHHPLMVHGSFANRTPGARRAVVVNMCRDGVKSASDEPLLAGVPPVPAGTPLGGQFFPLLRASQAADQHNPCRNVPSIP